MNCLISADKTQLDTIVAQINTLCGWPDGFTQTATVVLWSDKVQTYWCSIDDDRILSIISQVDLGGLIIQDTPINYFVFDTLI